MSIVTHWLSIEKVHKKRGLRTSFYFSNLLILLIFSTNLSGLSLAHSFTKSGRPVLSISSLTFILRTLFSDTTSDTITSPKLVCSLDFNCGVGATNVMSNPFSLAHEITSSGFKISCFFWGNLPNNFLLFETTAAILNEGVTIITIFCTSKPKNVSLVKITLPNNFVINSS